MATWRINYEWQGRKKQFFVCTDNEIDGFNIFLQFILQKINAGPMIKEEIKNG